MPRNSLLNLINRCEKIYINPGKTIEHAARNEGRYIGNAFIHYNQY